MNPGDHEAIVIDASVGIKLFLLEEGSEQAHQLFRLITSDPTTRFFVPDLFFVECANILWKYSVRFDYSRDQAMMDLEDLLNLSLITVPSRDLVSAALNLATSYDITAYDSCYIALSRQLDVPLVTADWKLAQKLADHEFQILNLMDL